MSKMSHSKFLENRALLFRKSLKKTEHKKGNVIQAHYYCTICGDGLSNMSLTTFKKTAKRDFVRLKLDDLITVNLCKNSASCYKRVQKEE